MVVVPKTNRILFADGDTSLYIQQELIEYLQGQDDEGGLEQ